MPPLNPDLQNRLILSLFCVLISMLLLYFWYLSLPKLKANQRDGSGLFYLGLSYLLYATLGLVSVFQPLPVTLLIVSGLIGFALLSSLPFFSLGTHQIDRIVTHPRWRNGVKYAGFAWVILASLISEWAGVYMLDTVLTVVTLSCLGFFIVRYFWQRQLRFIAVIAAGYFATFILLQIWQPGSLSEGKFTHLNTLVLGPALVLSVISLAYTFNWLNELDFYELSNIWVAPPSAPQAAHTAYAPLTQPGHRSDWLEKMAKDEIETVIEEMIILRKHRHENLEDLLNLASRNTRNNTHYLKDLIKYEDYQLNRNKIAHALTQMVKEAAH
ncbi:MAG: hypothetical protein D6722_04805 [Bacteroidetes bacterium]|nr:MAG: hypothetical protein D6722_04805 [Bacteroidota bacterium]